MELTTVQQIILILESIGKASTFMALFVIGLGYTLWRVVWYVISKHEETMSKLTAAFELLRDSIIENTQATNENKKVLEKCHIKNESRT